jgi:outer membrane protein assembly complex protein YaeT
MRGRVRAGAVALAAAWWLGACAAAPEEAPAASIDVTFTGTGELGFRLRRVIEDLLIDFERDPKSEVPLFDAALDLQDHFVDAGYPEAKVTYTVRREPKLAVEFAIHEGPQVTLLRPRFRGNESILDADLLALWSRRSSGQLGLGDPLFVEADLVALRLSMLALYDNRGFLEVAVDAPRIERAPGAARADVEFAITEGPRYRFGTFAIAPEVPLTAADLGATALPGRPFDRVEAATLGIRARTELLHRGYPEPRVDLEVTPDAASRTVALRLVGQPGPRATVAAIKIAGNERTAAHVIERHVAMQPGQLFDGQSLERTTSELYRTGLFRRVEIERTPRDATGEQIDLTVRVDEVDAHELDVLLGYGSYETLRGGVFWTDRNLFGLGQRLQLGARASLKGEALTASWSEPSFFASDTSLTVGGYLRSRQEPTFDDESKGFDLAFAREVVAPLRARWGYSLQQRDGSDIDPTVADPSQNRYEIGSVFGELVADRRDSPLYPGRGYRASLKYEHAGQGVGGNVDLDRLTWNGGLFLPLAPDLVLGLSARTAVIWSLDPAGVPVQERLYNGGESTVRSFRESQLGPRSVTGTPLGGSFSNTFNVELRFPILAALQGAVFADAGNVGVDENLFTFGALDYGFGAGLRLVLPIGPVRLDGAVNPNPGPEDRRTTLHFSVGLPF